MLRMLVLIILVLAGCTDRPAPKPSMTDEPTALAVADALDRDLRSFASLGPVERRAAELAFGPRLRRDLDVCTGTRYENRPLYLLAQWLLVHGGEAGPSEVLRLLDRLDILPTAGFRNAGRALRVTAMLRLGRVVEARTLAVAVQEVVPEFGALRHVEFYEAVGTEAPALPGLAVGGGRVGGDDDLVLLCFVPLSDPGAGDGIAALRAAAPEPPVRLVAVAVGGDMLAATAAAAAWRCQVRWMRQGDAALDAWKIPALPVSVLLGPGPRRLIVAVDPAPSALARLAPTRP